MNSLIECIANCGAPTSTVFIPMLAEMDGPMVDPDGVPCFTISSCTGTSTRLAIWYRIDVVSASVVYF